MNAGWNGGLPKKSLELLRREIPAVATSYFEMVAAMYQREREEAAPPKSPALRKALRGIQELAGSLEIALGTLPPKAATELREAAKAAGRPMLVEEAEFILQALYGLGREAADGIKGAGGRPREAKRILVDRLIDLLRGHGVETSDGENSLLTLAAREIVIASNDHAGDELTTMVQRALENKTPSD
jgi:hypothetical protein